MPTYYIRVAITELRDVVITAPNKRIARERARNGAWEEAFDIGEYTVQVKGKVEDR